jgi:hypothetical protein
MTTSEAERAAFNVALIDALEGTIVQVRGATFGDEMNHELSRKGAQTVIDMLKARDFRIVRAE